jgi:hypothetical protein
MKKFFKKFIPNSVLVIWRRRNRRTKIRNKSAKDVFTEIYKSNLWGSSESISGTGSVKEQTESLINELDKLLKDMNISSILDIPCGDFNWMQKVDLSNIDYIGADIVEELIENNIKQYKERENIYRKVI